MCLSVFCEGKDSEYKKLESGAKQLGAAYQKVNFLRDFSTDANELGRIYFPNVDSSVLSELQKEEIITDIKNDFSEASPYIAALPESAKKAVTVSYAYYAALLRKLEATPVEVINNKRIRVSALRKTVIFAKIVLLPWFPLSTRSVGV
jgi:15-cis-phytoene synthase